MANEPNGVVVFDRLDLSHSQLPFLSVEGCFGKHREVDTAKPLCSKGLKLPVLTIWEAAVSVLICANQCCLLNAVLDWFVEVMDE